MQIGLRIFLPNEMWNKKKIKKKDKSSDFPLC